MLGAVDNNYSFNNYLNNISKMEVSEFHFICADCPNNFVFAKWKDFKDHMCSNKSGSHFECIYCGLLILWNYGKRHIDNHFNPQNNCLYQCPNCIFSTNNGNLFSRHLLVHYKTCSNDISRCKGCDESFTSVEELIKHVDFHTFTMYNCCLSNCIVKCSDKSQMCDHYKRCHPSKVMMFEISLCLSCHERSPDIMYTRQLLACIPSLAPWRSICSLAANQNRKRPSQYFECFKCNFSTIRWHNFIRHYFKCGLADKGDNEDSHIYICSACSTMSTKKHFVDEHMLECDRHAKLLTEELPKKESQECSSIRTLGSNNQVCKRSHSVSSDSRDEISCKRLKIDDSPESKCQTEEAMISDFEDEDLNSELVRIHFDEEGFRCNNPSMSYRQKEIIIEKMRQFSQTHFNVVDKENCAHIPECPDCHKVFSYDFDEFKSHFMSVHLNIEPEQIKNCLLYTRWPRVEDKCAKKTFIDNDRIRVPLSYSKSALAQLTELLPFSSQKYLSEKMDTYSRMAIIIHTVDNSRRFLCHQCSYSSPYALADVRKHIMGSHCGISTKHFRYCLQASRLDPNEFTLLPDDKILNLAKDLTLRTQQKDLSQPKPLESPHNTRFQKWSKTPKTEYTEPTRDRSLGGRKGVNSLFLTHDSDFSLTLPFSETVLRTLLQSVIHSDEIGDIVQKMKLYSNYSLKRLCNNERTVAFQCPCGRVFHTSRIPSLKMRAATLADARRHVMGVHAKIPQSLITVCCQASRICRENEFELYSDEMLLQLASERHGKLPESLSCSNEPQLSPSITLILDQSSLSPVPTMNSFLSANVHEEEAATSRLEEEQSRVERVIPLPYSLDALRRLTDGLCEPGFFPVLQQKMDIYSKYKIFIVRRDARRLFCCSGCVSSSPHGMGDVKKHILGVHARIPERFKAAAMHCSRLSREDTTLLPDHLLLQLATVKWRKGGGGGQRGQSRFTDPAAGSSSSSSTSLFVQVIRRPSGCVFKCSACDHESRLVGHTKAHLVRDHLRIPAHSCALCEQLFNSRASVVSHHQKVHGQAPFVLTHYKPYKVALSKVLVSNTSSPLPTTTIKISPLKRVDKSTNSFLESGLDLSDYDVCF